MNALISATKSEFAKLIIRKKYIVLTVIGILISFIFLGSNALIAKFTSGEIVIKSNLIMTMLRLVTDILVPLIVFMAVTDLFAGETQEGTMKASLMRPLSRMKVMASKCLAVFILSCFVMTAMFLSCFVIQLISGSGIENAPFTFAAYIIDMVPVLALIALAMLINMVSKNPTLAMLLCIVVYALFKYMNFYVSPFGQMLFTSYSQWHRLWLGSTLPFGAMLSKVGILFGSVLILSAASYIIFEKQDY